MAKRPTAVAVETPASASRLVHSSGSPAVHGVSSSETPTASTTVPTRTAGRPRSAAGDGAHPLVEPGLAGSGDRQRRADPGVQPVLQLQHPERDRHRRHDQCGSTPSRRRSRARCRSRRCRARTCRWSRTGSVEPTRVTRPREPLCSTIASSTESTHSEHGLTPSTNPITRVLTSSEVPPRSTVPEEAARRRSSGRRARGRRRSPVERRPTLSISSAMASSKPIQTRSPIIVTGTPVGSNPSAFGGLLELGRGWPRRTTPRIAR